MTEKQSESQTLIDRYLAGRLDATEREMVETRIVYDADFRNEVELTMALRDGLRQLQAEGQVQRLLGQRASMWKHLPLAIAATVMACAIGISIFLVDRPADDGRQEMVTETLLFMKTRSGDARPDVTWQQPSRPARIEMRFDVGLEPAAEYRVAVDRVSNGATEPVHEVRAARTVEGEVSISVDSALLVPGDYRIRLVPKSPDDLDGATDFSMHVTE